MFTRAPLCLFMGGSLMDNPPSAMSPLPSPSPLTVQEEGVVESVPLPTPTPTPTSTPIPTPTPATPTTAPELISIPPPIMQLMRGFNERLSSGESSGVPLLEGMPYYLGAFLAVALEWRAQAKSKADEARTLQTLR